MTEIDFMAEIAAAKAASIAVFGNPEPADFAVVIVTRGHRVL